MTARTLGAMAIVGLMLSGCADSGPRQTSGAMIGGVTGGLIGNAIGHGNGRAATTIFGAAMGAIIGAQIGRALDERDREYAYLAADRGLRSNRVEHWKNPETGHRGQFKPRRTYRGEDGMCRDFDNTIWVDGEPELVEGTACEMADGSWRVVG